MDAGPDAEVAAVAARENRVLVTENVKDFPRTEGIVIVIVCVLESRPRTHGMDEQLAAVLDAWADVNEDPYVGLHWPFPAAGKHR